MRLKAEWSEGQVEVPREKNGPNERRRERGREGEGERERVKRPGLRTLGEEVKECSHAERRQRESDQRELGERKKRGKNESTRQRKWRRERGREGRAVKDLRGEELLREKEKQCIHSISPNPFSPQTPLLRS